MNGTIDAWVKSCDVEDEEDGWTSELRTWWWDDDDIIMIKIIMIHMMITVVVGSTVVWRNISSRYGELECSIIWNSIQWWCIIIGSLWSGLLLVSSK